MSDYMAVCEQAARAGGAVLLDWQGLFTAKSKGPKDLVTEADYAAQDAVQKVLQSAYPEFLFVGEESEAVEPEAVEKHAVTGQHRWVVDPLDGTINYVHGLPFYGVSVALERDGQLIAGAVYNPTVEECFAAESGSGAFLNGSPLTASSCEQLDEALVAVSLAPNVPPNSRDVRNFLGVLHSCRSIRRQGSAALNLCFVAAGRMDAYVAGSLKPWDTAAGALLIQESGGVITSMKGAAFDPWNPELVAAATPALHTAMLEIVASAE